MTVISFLDALDKKIFLLLNGMHSPFWDSIMWQISGKYIWIPFYLAIIYFIIRSRKWKTFATIVFIALMIVMSDQVSGIIKDSVLRYRPSHNPEFANKIHLLTDPRSNQLYRGGDYGFVSSHAANTFALAIFLTLFFKRRWVGISLFIWAIIVSYSRIYLGVHYPFDILGGAIVGLMSGIIIYYAEHWFYSKYLTKTDKKQKNPNYTQAT